MQKELITNIYYINFSNWERKENITLENVHTHARRHTHNCAHVHLLPVQLSQIDIH